MQEEWGNKIKRIGILRGGFGNSYENSLLKGGEFISHLRENLLGKYKAIDLLVDREGIWYLGGLPVNPAELGHRIDLVWNFSHPNLSQVFENISVPSIGSDSFHFILKNNKTFLREHLKKIGIKMPQHIILPVFQEDFDGPREKYAFKKAKEVFEKFGSPWLVKSFIPNSNMGEHVAKTFPELISAIEDGTRHGESILIEELIPGKKASVHNVAGFRGKEVYTFPVFNFSNEEKEKLILLSKNIFNHIGGKNYLKIVFILNSNKGIYLENIEFYPDLNKNSDFSRVCDYVGTKTHSVIDHILESC